MSKHFRALLAMGLAPAEAAEQVLQAIRDERFYILTHEETKARVCARMEDILASRNPTLLPVA